jgi:hypothetical protein
MAVIVKIQMIKEDKVFNLEKKEMNQRAEARRWNLNTTTERKTGNVDNPKR